MLTAKHSLQSCLLKSARPHLSTLRLRQLTTMTPELSSSRSLYSQIHSLSNTFNQGWLRKDIITVTRSVRDIDDDRSKLFTEMYDLSPDEGILQPIKGNSFELVRPIFHDISPSGNITLSLKHGGKNDELPLINLSGDQSSHYLDASEYHDKFVGDSWFGGVSWSHDERCILLAAMGCIFVCRNANCRG